MQVVHLISLNKNKLMNIKIYLSHHVLEDVRILNRVSSSFKGGNVFLVLDI